MVKRRKVEKRKTALVRTKNTRNYLGLFLFGLGCLTFLAVGLPLALWANAGESNKIIDVQDADMLLVQTKLEKINERMDTLMQKVDSLNIFDDASADCLNQCRSAQALCLETKKVDNSNGLLNICAQKNQDCVLQCDVRTKNSISCQDGCAISLGGCIERVIAPQKIVLEDEVSMLDVCVRESSTCLQKMCDFTDDIATQNEVCQDQCQRLKNICQSGRAGYDETALDLCERLNKTCEHRVCGIRNMLSY
jgi:hypothetical protein